MLYMACHKERNLEVELKMSESVQKSNPTRTNLIKLQKIRAVLISFLN